MWLILGTPADSWLYQGNSSGRTALAAAEKRNVKSKTSKLFIIIESHVIDMLWLLVVTLRYHYISSLHSQISLILIFVVCIWHHGRRPLVLLRSELQLHSKLRRMRRLPWSRKMLGCVVCHQNTELVPMATSSCRDRRQRFPLNSNANSIRTLSINNNNGSNVRHTMDQPNRIQHVVRLCLWLPSKANTKCSLCRQLIWCWKHILRNKKKLKFLVWFSVHKCMENTYVPCTICDGLMGMRHWGNRSYSPYASILATSIIRWWFVHDCILFPRNSLSSSAPRRSSLVSNNNSNGIGASTINCSIGIQWRDLGWDNNNKLINVFI